ncbi:LysR family transcriptional regulator [Streptomyces griseus]|uniref:LysR family transcriptional regulator n=1 Tax=Streptomyces griseus TaxID=1911 RepID=UPI0037B3EA54
MQLFQVEYFVAVAETLSFTKGARRANVVQSAASTAVHRLERELGCELFERKGRTVRLTTAGTALLPHAYALLNEVRAARDAVDATRGVIRGEVTFGTLVHPGPIDLLKVLAQLRHEHDGVVVKLRQTIRGTASSLDEVRDGTLDLALVSSAQPSVPGVHLTHLYAEPFVLIHSERHPLAARPAVELTDTVTEAFIDFPQGWGNRGAIDALFAEHGLDRRVRTEVVAFDMALELVRSDLGIAFVPRSTVTDATGIRVRAVGDADVRWPVQLARSTARSLSAAGRVVSQAVLSHVHDGP